MPFQFDKRGRMVRISPPKKYRERIQEEYWDDGTYWIALKPGFKDGSDPLGAVHGIHEDTPAEAYKALRDSIPCDCKECKTLREAGR